MSDFPRTLRLSLGVALGVILLVAAALLAVRAHMRGKVHAAGIDETLRTEVQRFWTAMDVPAVWEKPFPAALGTIPEKCGYEENPEDHALRMRAVQTRNRREGNIFLHWYKRARYHTKAAGSWFGWNVHPAHVSDLRLIDSTAFHCVLRLKASGERILMHVERRAGKRPLIRLYHEPGEAAAAELLRDALESTDHKGAVKVYELRKP